MHLGLTLFFVGISILVDKQMKSGRSKDSSRGASKRGKWKVQRPDEVRSRHSTDHDPGAYIGGTSEMERSGKGISKSGDKL